MSFFYTDVVSACGRIPASHKSCGGLLSHLKLFSLQK